MPERWDIFCRVIDNFGDAGVCWRLARQLAREQGGHVRLWIDDLQSLKRLQPAVAEAGRQTVESIEVHGWGREPADTVPADVVIDAFGCGLPEAYADAMAREARKHIWIVLEYLSAEPWVREHHGLPSPHPRLPLQRYFFFPGFVQGTGGLLRERDLFAQRDAFEAARRNAFWQSLGHAPVPADIITISMFAYDEAPLVELLRCWEAGPEKIVVAVPESSLLPIVLSHFGADRIPRHAVLQRGALEARILPFIPQARHDELLWSCDCNFVRGEDSFVRAQWAARPFVWHVYPQQDGAHRQKLEAFLDLYCNALPAPARAALVGVMRLWNQFDAPGVSHRSAWAAFMAQREVLRRHTRTWADRIAGVGSLVDNLASFCRDKLE